METKRLTLFIAVIFLGIGSHGAFAQEADDSYTRAIGGRFGVANGITYKHFLNESHAIDGIVNFQGNRSFTIFKLLGLYEIHQPINFVDVEGLRWYYGFGGGLGHYRYKDTDSSGLAWSFDGVVGADYKIPEAPINLSLDWKPTMELTPESGVRFDGIGLSIRFVF
ncbi:hypothetical protein [Parapedobacter sp. 2B3]|uniref:hypothetical protein n=1 Tax=Parapedobacter sp. 2B3 TaxID=3342381 RepID=UPI0035B570EC